MTFNPEQGRKNRVQGRRGLRIIGFLAARKLAEHAKSGGQGEENGVEVREKVGL